MPESVSATTILRYLFGDKQAIQSLLECPRALWVGLIFVLSAGFAREYDAESLVHEPWYLLIPVAASLLTSFLLYALLYRAALSKSDGGRRFVLPSSPDDDIIGQLNNRVPQRGFWELYPSFLALYWLTAPLAWLYAIPVERFLPPLEAAQVNYALLAIVSVWRVLLITRVASYLFSASYGQAICLVLLFGDTIVLVASFTMPQPLLQVMGGVRLNALESLNANMAASACVYSVLLWPVFFTVAIAYAGLTRDTWSMPLRPEQRRKVDRAVWILALASIAIWVAILPFTQPQQFLRYRVERELIHGDLRRGLAMMSEHQPHDFPLDWSPPPYWGKHVYEPNLGDVLTVISTEPVADWVAETYWSIADERFEEFPLFWMPGQIREQGNTLVIYLDRHPNRNRAIKEVAPQLRQFVANSSDSADSDRLAVAEEFKRLLESAPGEDLLKEPSPEQLD